MTIAVVAIVVVGVILRFVATGPLWEDEAQSVAIASEPLRMLPTALRHDGSPPLWYYLLHFWIRVFGDSTRSVRVMSGIPAVLCLPVMYLLGRRIAGPSAGLVSLLLLASSPFALRYSGEARMYSLVMLLSLLAAHAFLWVHRERGWKPIAVLSIVVALMLYTHYDAIWLGLLVGAGELFFVVRRRRSDPALAAGARRVLIALVVAAVLYVPWLPSLAYQSAHTGAPWQSPPTLIAILVTLQAWDGGLDPWGQIGEIVTIALVVVAVLGRRTDTGIVLRRPGSVPASRLLAVSGGAVVFMILESMAARQAYVDRYGADVVCLFLLVIALGILVLPTGLQRVAIGVLVATGLVAGGLFATSSRTQVGEASAAIESRAQAGDVVLDCPDQLGPSMTRLLPADLRQVSYPTLGPTRIINWVGWGPRQTSVPPQTVARNVLRLAAGHRLFVVYGSPTSTLLGRCNQLIVDLAADAGAPQQLLASTSGVVEPASVDEWVKVS